jgi:hypothetical protein
MLAPVTRTAATRSRQEGIVMALTTDHVQTTETPSPTTPSPSKRPRPSARVVVGWAAVVAGLGAAAVLTASIIASDGNTPNVEMGRTVAEHGSISAIDHREQEALLRHAMTRVVAVNGSVSAIDHREREALAGPLESQVIAEHGSVTAIDHREREALTVPL